MSIKSINKADVSKITSGQVIIDLKSIVKELVENAIDAECSKIELNFQNYGIDFISITDDGKGIPPEDFESVCLRSHTSKIVAFDDLNNLNTLGFRGEALNSICSISHRVKIKTCTEYPKNYELEYDNLGKLSKSQSKIGGGFSKKTGTSISIEKLFVNLPVRFKNFIKNSKREFHKAITFLTQYLLIYPEIKFSVFNEINGKKSLVLSGRGGAKTSVLDNMITVFGSNGAKGLIPISLSINEDIKLEGYISSYSFGLGRSVTDRQFLFVNKRPVNLKKLAKIINDVYKLFNHVQYPIFIVNIEINPSKLDVNLTPDKTFVMIHQESEVFEMIRTELSNFFEKQDNVIPKNKNREPDEVNRSTYESSDSKPGHILVISDVVRTASPDQEIKHLQHISHQNTDAEESLTVTIAQTKEVTDDLDENGKVTQNTTDSLETSSLNACEVATSRLFIESDPEELGHHEILSIEKDRKANEIEDDADPSDSSSGSPKRDSSELECNCDGSSVMNVQVEAIELPESDGHGKNFHPVSEEEDLHIQIGNQEFEERPFKRIKTDQLHSRCETISSEQILAQIANRREHPGNANKKSDRDIKLMEINDEQELSYIISKEDFTRMKLIGQFNLGFILVTLNKKNLFIIDQHASDEKYNFERLNQEFRINIQRLVVPQTVELSIIDELLVIENESTFRANGFQFTVDYESNPGSRITLLSYPSSKGTVFGINDFHELINLINANPRNKHIKCSKIWSLLAMRACRSSIMIGQTLAKSKMSKVVRNLYQLDKPWNCPHGRPTMRHLIELNNWHDNYSDYEL
ncbi:uncharacterized protein RJT20DRAFT_117505 [Scheffersomyces xylosifermentans]|uniref:uncharacterized protein n=1 Tax=Scheffersomyces xylosifermentans TaxID=1304137 RepID=UPI00315CD890